jgi:hypothetical protein
MTRANLFRLFLAPSTWPVRGGLDLPPPCRYHPSVNRIFALVLALLSSAVGALALDASYVGVIKSYRYQQTNSGSPVVLASNAYAFNAFAYSTNGGLTNATVKPPNSTPLRTLASDTNRLVWLFEELFNTATALDNAYPSSSTLNPFATFSYTFTLGGTNDGVHTVRPYYLSLGGSPGMPQITNFNQAQIIDTTRDFTLRFIPSGGTLVPDVVQLTVLDSASNAVFASPFPFTPGALDGTSASALIPANSLPPGQTLVGHLTFARPHAPDTNSYPGVLAVPAIARDLQFPLKTRPAPVPPVLQGHRGAPFRLTFIGETNRVYRLQATTNWLTWDELLVTNLTAPSGSFTDTKTGQSRQRSYRIQVGP